MTQHKENSMDTMKQLQDILKNERSAREIAKIAHCSVPTVHRHLQALKEAGAVLAETKVPTNKTGPIPTRYRLVKGIPR